MLVAERVFPAWVLPTWQRPTKTIPPRNWTGLMGVPPLGNIGRPIPETWRPGRVSAMSRPGPSRPCRGHVRDMGARTQRKIMPDLLNVVNSVISSDRMFRSRSGKCQESVSRANGYKFLQGSNSACPTSSTPSFLPCDVKLRLLGVVIW